MQKLLVSVHHQLRILALGVIIASASGCANMADPYNNGYGSPYNNGYGNGYGSPYGGGYNAPPPGYYGGGGYYGGPGYYGNGPADRRERQRLEDERRRLEEERRRLEREREQNQRPSPPPMMRPTQDRCPSGFSPSENKCSPEERRRGCRDMRLPSGLGCVSR